MRIPEVAFPASKPWMPALEDAVQDGNTGRLWRVVGMPAGLDQPMYTLSRHGRRIVCDEGTLHLYWRPVPSLEPPVVGDIFVDPATQQRWQVVARTTSAGSTHRLQAVGEIKVAVTLWAVTTAELRTEFIESTKGVATSSHAEVDRWVAERVEKGEYPLGGIELPNRNERWDVSVQPLCAAKVDAAWFERVSSRCSGVVCDLQKIDEGSTKTLLRVHPDTARAAEAWQHAACLSIAEAAPGWEFPTGNDSPAMVAVRALRRRYEDEKMANDTRRAERRRCPTTAHASSSTFMSRADQEAMIAIALRDVPPGATERTWRCTLLALVEQQPAWSRIGLLALIHTATLSVREYERARQLLLRGAR
jgi:hypothetical protein